jgi:hypothetical protein
MRRRIIRASVAVGVSTVSIVGLATPAWAPKITFGPGPASCKDGGWSHDQPVRYKNQGECVADYNHKAKAK